LEKFGAKLIKVAPVSIISANHFVNQARKLAAEDPNGFFANQFDNLDNHITHHKNTGREIFEQTNGDIDTFVMGAGTGGTVVGVAKYIRALKENFRVYIADPTGSGLYNRIHHGTMFSVEEKEGTRGRNQVDTIVEGIGMNRITGNLDVGLAASYIDGAVKVSDQEAVSMARYLMSHEGLFVGSSSAVNCVAAVRVAREYARPGNQTIVTVLADSGMRHLTKFWSNEYLTNLGLSIEMDEEPFEAMPR